MIAIIDYGMGNLRSVQKGFEKVGYQAVVVDDPGALREAQAIVLPGVGAFGDAAVFLEERGFAVAIREELEQGKPFLGICLGLQLLFSWSEEAGENIPGLGVFPGRVRRLPQGLKVPHMGWNQVELRKESPLFEGVPNGSYFYFVHSFCVETPDEEIVLGVTDYGISFPSAVCRGNIFGVQFHPEKSSTLGLRLLANFGRLVSRC